MTDKQRPERQRIDVINAQGEKVVHTSSQRGAKPAGRAARGAHFSQPANGTKASRTTTQAAPAMPATGAVAANDPHLDQEAMRIHEQGTSTRGRKGRHGKTAAIVVGAVCAVYLGGCALWSHMYMPNTTINGESVAFKTADAVAKEMSNKLSNYSLSASGDNVSLALKGKDIDLKFDTSAYAADTMSKVNVWAWPVSIFTGNDLSAKADVSYSKEKLASLVKTAVDSANQSATQPQSATASFDEKEGKFVVVKEKAGTAVDADAVTKAVRKAILQGKSDLGLGESELVQPKYTSKSTELEKAVETANKYVAAKQTLTANGKTVTSVEPKTIAQWITFGDDLSVSLNTDAIKQWASGDLAKSLNTVGAERKYQRADGKQVTVSGGTYGWSVDGDQLASTLASNIEGAKEASFDVPWSQKASEWNPGGADWGSRYLDVDITEQHVRFYDGGKIIWESDFVSGDPTEDHATPTGVYSINGNKGTNQTLKGLDENHDGEPDYTSHVNYWMPFITNLVAFHDASWRSSFGGTIYQGNGSHGCINLPAAAAKQLYDITKVGDVVVVHA